MVVVVVEVTTSIVTAEVVIVEVVIEGATEVATTFSEVAMIGGMCDLEDVGAVVMEATGVVTPEVVTTIIREVATTEVVGMMDPGGILDLRGALVAAMEATLVEAIREDSTTTITGTGMSSTFNDNSQYLK